MLTLVTSSPWRELLTSSRMAAACWVVSFLESCMVTCTQAEAFTTFPLSSM